MVVVRLLNSDTSRRARGFRVGKVQQWRGFPETATMRVSRLLPSDASALSARDVSAADHDPARGHQRGVHEHMAQPWPEQRVALLVEPRPERAAHGDSGGENRD